MKTELTSITGLIIHFRVMPLTGRMVRKDKTLLRAYIGRTMKDVHKGLK